MIVKCEQCQTRFKIPDDKVTDKGVKVRCTKCSHTFRVTKEGTTDATSEVPALQTSTQVAHVPKPPPSRPEATVVGARPSAPAPDPFSAFGGAVPPPAPEATRPGVFALGVEATRLPSLAPPSAPRAPTTAPAPFDFSQLIPTAPPPPPVRPAPTRSLPIATQPLPVAPAVAAPTPRVVPATSAPFDFSALGPSSAAPGVPAASTPFDFSALGPASPAPAMPAQRAAPATFDFAAVAPPPPPPPAPPAYATDAPGGSLMDDVPAAGTDAFFSSDAPTAGMSMLSDVLPSSDVPADSFEAAPGTESQGAELGEAAAVAVTVARLTKPKPEQANASTDLAAAHRPRGRSALSVVVNIVIAALLGMALLVVGAAALNDGKVDASVLSVAHLQRLIAAQSDFVPNDISNGLYDTKAGKPVFYVRGEVVNRSANAARVIVRADIVDGSTEAVVRSAEVVAGSPPTPEQLHALAGADEVQRLHSTVSDSAVAVEPGQSAPFVVTFFEYPPDLKAFRVRVVARAAAGETAAK